MLISRSFIVALSIATSMSMAYAQELKETLAKIDPGLTGYAIEDRLVLSLEKAGWTLPVAVAAVHEATAMVGKEKPFALILLNVFPPVKQPGPIAQIAFRDLPAGVGDRDNPEAILRYASLSGGNAAGGRIIARWCATGDGYRFASFCAAAQAQADRR